MFNIMIYIVFERRDKHLGHRILHKLTVGAQDLNGAKAKVTRLIGKNELLSKWRAMDTQAKWSPIIEEHGKTFVNKTFRNPPDGAAENDFAVIAEVVIGG